MKRILQQPYFLYLKNFSKKTAKGFTLIELLVVVIIIGILSALSIPSVLKQVEKARQSEAKNNLGVINRAQEVHMFEKAIFATDMAELNVQLTVGQLNGGNYETEFYIYSVNGTPGSNEVHHSATAKPTYTNDIKDITSAIFRSGYTFQSVICEADNATVTPQIVNANTCTDGELVY